MTRTRPFSPQPSHQHTAQWWHRWAILGLAFALLLALAFFHTGCATERDNRTLSQRLPDDIF